MLLMTTYRCLDEWIRMGCRILIPILVIIIIVIIILIAWMKFEHNMMQRIPITTPNYHPRCGNYHREPIGRQQVNRLQLIRNR